MTKSTERQFKNIEPMFHREKPKTSNVIICTHCKKPSGYVKKDLVYLTGNVTLFCKNPGCGSVAVRHLSGAKFTVEEVKAVDDLTGRKYWE